MDIRFPISPATVAAECFCMNLKRATRLMARRYDEALEPVDLNNGQYSTLMAVAGLQPASMQKVADMLGMDRTTLTATLKPLQRRSLLSIYVDTADRRTRILRLTDAGEALLRQALPLWKKVQQAVSRNVSRGADLEFREQLARLA